MTALIMDGNACAAAVRERVASTLRDAGAPHVCLATVLVGEDPASLTYVANKEKSCREVGFMSSVYRYPETTTEKQLLEIIDFLNNDPEIDAETPPAFDYRELWDRFLAANEAEIPSNDDDLLDFLIGAINLAKIEWRDTNVARFGTVSGSGEDRQWTRPNCTTS